MISCWGDANAQAPAEKLAALFPHARVQRKGLIATEAFVCFQWLSMRMRRFQCARTFSSSFPMAPIGRYSRINLSVAVFTVLW